MLQIMIVRVRNKHKRFNCVNLDDLIGKLFIFVKTSANSNEGIYLLKRVKILNQININTEKQNQNILKHNTTSDNHKCQSRST